MFSFRKQSAQAKKHASTSKETFEFEWKTTYNWLLLIIVVLIGAGYLGQQDTLLPIKKIKLSGTFEHIDQAEVTSALQPFVGEGFFSLDIHALRKMLGEKSWTESVSIRRVWPDRLDITIIEREPIARWDDKQLISNRAVVFAADVGRFQALPLINARNNNTAQILSQYYKLNRRFKALDETVLSLRQDSRGALDFELSGGLTIKVGRDQIEQKITRLIAIYKTQIQPRRANIRRLDLRYSNGFAVAWKKEILEARDKASIWSNNNV